MRLAISGTDTLGTRVSQRQTHGFDYLRVALAASVILWHSFNVAYGPASDRAIRGTGLDILVRSIMPVFFALSGFLVAMSLERVRHLPTFLWFRSLRIFPALIVEVTLSALILGPLLTVYRLRDYFTDGQFFKYFLNILGWIHFELPGVFLSLPKSGLVNFSLWTVPSELECYILLAFLFAIGLFVRPRALWAMAIAYALLIAAMYPSDHYDRFTLIPARVLPLAFLAGVALSRSREKVPVSLPLGMAAVALMLVLLIHPQTSGFAAIAAAYVATAFGCTDAPRSRILESGDYSYGMYLYAYPIQQTVVLFLGPNRPLATLGASSLVIMLFAVLSWHAVEKHALRFKGVFQPPPRPAAGEEPSAPSAGRFKGVLERFGKRFA